MFPTLVGQKFAQIDLGRAALDWMWDRNHPFGGPSPFLDPAVCLGMIQDAHERLDVPYSYGGWLEYRGVLWRGSYLDEGRLHMHLGIDVNVPSGTPVAVDRQVTVLRVDCDAPEEHGWGTRIIVRVWGSDTILIYAHLAPETNVRPDDILPPGTVIGIVGKPEHNGGWFTHLHVQATTLGHYGVLLENDLRDLDGYGAMDDALRLAQVFPDPRPWVDIP